MSYDWSRFSMRIPVRASVPELYKAWTTRAGIEHWFLRTAAFTRNGRELDAHESIQAGDTYTWMWHGYTDDVFEKGEILEANGKDLMRFRFGNAGDVTVRLYPEKEWSIVELTQENIALDDKSRASYHVGCMQGWTFHLADLKCIFEGGPDLRNKDIGIRNVISS